MAVAENSTRIATIAQSDTWAALGRIGGIVAGAVATLILVPLVIWIATTTEHSDVTLSAHSGEITAIQGDVTDIKAKVGADHDEVTTLKVEMNDVSTQIQKLWDRPAPAGSKH